MDNRPQSGPLAWMAQNSVAANLLMIFLLVGGLISALQIKQEVFPEFDLDIVTVSVPYPGASPEEIERGIILAIEEEVRSIDGVKKVSSSASEGSGNVQIELMTGTDRNKGLQDIKAAVDRITSFPQDAERPIVSLISTRRAVISLILYGDLKERTLKNLAETVRDELLDYPEITLVEVAGTRPPEISIEVPHEKLRAYNLTLDEIAAQVARAAVEIPAGGVKSKGGEILLRTDERRDYGSEFENIPIVSGKEGSRLLLSDLADVKDDFRDIDLFARFNGQPAVQITVFRVGSQTPIEISRIVNDYAKTLQKKLPPGVGVATANDRSEIYRDRISLLLRNASLGLVLVLIILGLFLEGRLAFWVTMGIPISFFGAFLFIPLAGASINMISLFAFIISLGIVVDDAIVVGENIYEYRQQGMPYMQAAINGAKDVKIPVCFAVLTNIVAFMPMLFIPGVMGKFFFVIPIIVTSVFSISLIESLLVLPAHLGHQKKRERNKENWLGKLQHNFSDKLGNFIANYYQPLCRFCLDRRYLTMSIGLALLLVTAGYFKGGRINFTFMPKVDADTVSVKAVLPYGVPVAKTEQLADLLYKSGKKILDQNGGDAISRGMLTLIGSGPPQQGPISSGASSGGSHLCSVTLYLVPSDQREVSASDLAAAWRNEVGELGGLESLNFDYTSGPSSGADINIELSHSDIATLERAAARLADQMKQFAGVKDIDDGFAEGKPQLNFKVKQQARSLGVTASDLAAQVRSAFYGARAFRQQRKRDEIWVMVRLPEKERYSEHMLDRLLIRTREGGEIPLKEAAEVERGRAYTVINRRDGRRVVTVTAEVVPGVANADKVLADVTEEILPKLMADFPGLGYGFEGRQRDQREGLSSLLTGFLLAMIAVFTMLAIPFKSYIQPIIVMMAIPFGFIGAVLGHIIMGYDLSVVSLMGLIALSGVVVNDSLVLVYHANELSASGLSHFDAALQAGSRRFRPILLTSLTTFLGLAPMIFETSMQARFLIPMALSLGFGVLFATLITLLLIPALYIILDDIKAVFVRSE